MKKQFYWKIFHHKVITNVQRYNVLEHAAHISGLLLCKGNDIVEMIELRTQIMSIYRNRLG